jgi:hypothetical protein
MMWPGQTSSPPPTATMNSPLLSLLLLTVLSLTAAWPAYTQCVGNTTYAANSFYEANGVAAYSFCHLTVEPLRVPSRWVLA